MSNISIPPGVCADVAAERNYRRIESMRQLAAYDHEFTQRQQQIPGLLFPAYRLGEPTPYTYVLRPDAPRMGYGGKMVKYEWPERVPLCLDVLPSYREALNDPSIPVWITEGAKKSDALASAFNMAIVPININGVWGWRRKSKDSASHPIEDLDGIAWAGRRVILAFDNDVTRKPEVQDALRALERHLTKERGAQVGVLILPYDGEKMGVDDALAGGMTPDELQGYVHGLDDLDSTDDVDDLPLDELRLRLRAVIVERDQWKERAQQLELELGLVEEGSRLVVERNRFVTAATGANIASAGKRLTLIELKKELDTAHGDNRQEGEWTRIRPSYMGRCTNQNAGTISRHLSEFVREGWIERDVRTVHDPKTDKYTSATFVRTLVDLSDPSQVTLPAKPRGLHACSKCGSMKVKRRSVLRCTCCGHEESQPEEWVNPKEIRDMEDEIVTSQAAEGELLTAIQDEQPADDAATFFEQPPELAAEPLNCKMRSHKKDNDPSMSALQTAIHFPQQTTLPLNVSDPYMLPGVRSGMIAPDDPWIKHQQALVAQARQERYTREAPRAQDRPCTRLEAVGQYGHEPSQHPEQRLSEPDQTEEDAATVACTCDGSGATQRMSGQPR